MSVEVADSIIERVVAYCEKINASQFEFIFHGGEPLLQTPRFIESFAIKARQRLKHLFRPSFSLQTNGTLLTAEWCRVFKENGVGLGISLDGPAQVHNRSRVDHAGRPTYRQVWRGIRQVQKEGVKFAVLAVADLSLSPERTYGYFKQHRIGYMDVLWPDYHHDSLPDNYYNQIPKAQHTYFGDWWIGLFNCWFFDKEPKPHIRFLEQLILLILGINNRFEGVGRHDNTHLVIETDGGIEASDYLKACGNAFTKEGANVQSHSFNEAIQAPLIALHGRSHRVLPTQCQRCPICDVCGGGHLAHRYGRGRMFDNPSVYCFDLLKLITHIQNVVIGQLSDDLKEQTGLAPLTFREALECLTSQSR